MTNRDKDINNNNNRISNYRTDTSNKKLVSDSDTVHIYEENRRYHTRKEDEYQLLTKEDSKRMNKKVCFNFPKDYPIMSWFVDSGASEHMVNSDEYFDDSRELEKPTRVVVAKSGVELQATRVGTIRGHSIINGQRVEYAFKDVLFVPDLQANLFSVTKVVNLKLKVIFENSICKILKRDKEVAIAVREDKLYELKILLHSMYCTPSVMFLKHKKSTHDNTKTGKQTVVADPSVLKHIASVKKNIRNIEVRPTQKVHVQEL